MTATQEAVICLFDENENLVAVVRKNGSAKHYKVEEMGYGDLADLYDARTGPSV